MGGCLSSSTIAQNPSSPVINPGGGGKRNSFVISSPIGAKFRSSGSGEDVFLEAQTWLESDWDDEFFSVNGDLTPLSNTPVHRSLPAIPSAQTSQTKKTLSELFDNSEDGDQEDLSSLRKETDEDKKELKSTAGPPAPNVTSRSRERSINNRSQKSASCVRNLFCVSIPESPKSNKGVTAY